jgi:hypothetical protein
VTPGAVAAAARCWAGERGSPLYLLAMTGEIVRGCATEAWATLQEVQQQKAGTYTYDDADVAQLGQLAEWIERTGVRAPVRGWAAR